mmetsp:Transcript_34868/g.69571  ORF Transcript_34868/g.69571 Transcript_34868/m.69571 type:complete len:104 (-) Transcript_34868:283-594(-)
MASVLGRAPAPAPAVACSSAICWSCPSKIMRPPQVATLPPPSAQAAATMAGRAAAAVHGNHSAVHTGGSSLHLGIFSIESLAPGKVANSPPQSNLRDRPEIHV